MQVWTLSAHSRLTPPRSSTLDALLLGPRHPRSCPPPPPFVQVLWSHYAWRRGSVPLAWASVIKAGMEACQVAPQPYEDVEAYWTSVWARHQTQSVCCVNLMRQGGASPTITSPRDRTPTRSHSPTRHGTPLRACPLSFAPPGAAAPPAASDDEDDFGEFVAAPTVAQPPPPVHHHDPSRSRAPPVPAGLPPAKPDPVDDFESFMDFLESPPLPPSTPSGAGLEPDPALPGAEAEVAPALEDGSLDVVLVPSEPEAEAGGYLRCPSSPDAPQTGFAGCGPGCLIARLVGGGGGGFGVQKGQIQSAKYKKKVREWTPGAAPGTQYLGRGWCDHGTLEGG